ncbi:creatininase family protein [Saliphagus sp. LR7]|uniref:creatininase family protein n=1 Tax=Saliphagus sp. LR7 TaxID=2282654 RepID=UPI000DF7E14A|nr:creatininase family protein [Saliphagus sp. LR7]
MVLDPTVASKRAWTSQTYDEVNEIATEAGSVAVVPVGAVEQHGKHLPVGTDTLLVSAVAKIGCEQAREGLPVLFTPTIWCGLSDMHRGFGGGISLSVQTMAAVLEDVGGSVLDCGFDAILFLDGHVGNESVVGNAITSLGREHPDEEVMGIPYAQLARPVVNEVRESDIGGMFHAAEFETSLALELFAELVDEDAAEGELLNTPYDLRPADFFDGGPLSVYLHFEQYSETGAVGDPELASATKGERLFDAITDELAVLLERIHEENRD